MHSSPNVVFGNFFRLGSHLFVLLLLLYIIILLCIIIYHHITDVNFSLTLLPFDLEQILSIFSQPLLPLPG